MDLQQIEKLVQIIENSSMLEFFHPGRRYKDQNESAAEPLVFREKPQSPSRRQHLLPRQRKKPKMKLTSHLRLSALSTLLRHRKQKPS